MLRLPLSNRRINMKKLIVSLFFLGSSSLFGVAHAQTYDEYSYTPAPQRITVYEEDTVGLSPNTERINEGVVGNASLFERGLIHVYYTDSYGDWRWNKTRWQRWCDDNPRACMRQKEQWRHEWRYCQNHPDAKACYNARHSWYWGNYR